MSSPGCLAQLPWQAAPSSYKTSERRLLTLWGGQRPLKTPLGFQQHGTPWRQGAEKHQRQRLKRHPMMASKGWVAEAYSFWKLRQSPFPPCYSDPFISLRPKFCHLTVSSGSSVASSSGTADLLLLETVPLDESISFFLFVCFWMSQFHGLSASLITPVQSLSLDPSLGLCSHMAKSYSLLPALTLQSHGILCICMFPTAIKLFPFGVSNSLLSSKVLVCSVILF